MNAGRARGIGFTLIELLIAITVASVLATTAIPSFVTVLKNNQRAASVNQLLADFSFARSEAIKRGNRVSICRTSQNASPVPVCAAGDGWEDGWIVFDDEDGNGNPDATVDVLKTHASLQGEVTARGSGSVADVVPYLASGRLGTPAVGLIAWCDDRGEGAEAREIEIAPSGRVSAKKGSADCTP